MTIYTIGFTKKSAREFFEKLSSARIARLIDVRLNNVSQLAGFTKRDDLHFFCESILKVEYLHLPELAPTQEMLDAFKKNHGDWAAYEAQFLSLLAERKPEQALKREVLEHGCLLCSEPTPEHCHRRLVAERLRDKWSDVQIEHIL